PGRRDQLDRRAGGRLARWAGPGGVALVALAAIGALAAGCAAGLGPAPGVRPVAIEPPRSPDQGGVAGTFLSPLGIGGAYGSGRRPAVCDAGCMVLYQLLADPGVELAGRRTGSFDVARRSGVRAAGRHGRLGPATRIVRLALATRCGGLVAPRRRRRIDGVGCVHGAGRKRHLAAGRPADDD